jgi:MFS family permease
VVALFLREAPAAMGLLPDGGIRTANLAAAGDRADGLTWEESRGSAAFWLMVTAFVLLAASVHACAVHLPQLFADRGASAQTAAMASSIAGVALLAGRIGCGYFLDRYFGPYVAIGVCGLSALGIALLWIGAAGVPALAAAFLVGLGLGSEVDVIAFLMSRYFGLRSLGKTHGFAFAAFVLAGGVGPLAMGFAFDRSGSYRVPLAGFFAATLVATMLLARLGPYRFGVRGVETHVAAPAKAIELLRMTDGLVVHQTLCAAATLGIADLLDEGDRDSADLASALRVDEDALYRTLRFLAGHGVFREVGPRAFGNSALSAFMRTDVPGSVRSVLIFRGSRYYFSPFAEFLSTVETGVPARQKVLGTGAFEYLRAHPEEGRVFDDAMTAISALWAPAIAAAYDFGRWATVTDVGGGNGLLLAEILRTHPGLKGVLADEAPVLERARQRGLLSGGLADRVRFEPANFFEAVPRGSRAYVLKNIIHDWNDVDARRILLNCRRAMPDDGVLLLIEYRVGESNAPSLGTMVDMVMLTVTGGKERTVAQHRDLLASAGFRLSRTIPVSDEIVILEALGEDP